MSEKYKPLKGFIVVTGVPEGEEDLWIREAWVGIRLPIIGKLSNKFHVEQAAALELLKHHTSKDAPQAAVRWKMKGFPHKNEVFAFEESAVRIDGTLENVPVTCQQHLGLEEVGVGGHDANP